jgi:large subunit ribosomal protein L18
VIKREDRKKLRAKRHLRLRKRITGTSSRPRLCVYRSNAHIYAQIIDDSRGHTLVAASTLDPEIRAQLEGKGKNIRAARLVGERLAAKAKALGITKVVFDRGGNLYHGRVAALAEGARAGGLDF